MVKAPWSDLFLRSMTGIIMIPVFVMCFLFLPSLYSAMAFGLILLYILCVEMPPLLSYKQAPFWLLAPLYPILPFALLIYLTISPVYHMLAFYVIIVTFANDTGGYFFGKLFGKHKVAPRVSPGKTWEGTLGSYGAVMLTLTIILLKNEATISLPFITIFGACISVCATLGDLFESWLKRRVNIKDSGKILPGHGGFLDRFDGIMFVTLLCFFCRNYLVVIFNIG